tara:strand:- start:227 stop:481 length:255 start_codon:yes stop_codon:yes gene_type:complete
MKFYPSTYRPNAVAMLITKYGQLDITVMTCKTVITLIMILKKVLHYVPTEEKKEIRRVLRYHSQCKKANLRRLYAGEKGGKFVG